MKEKTRGGIFHWGREDGGELARFRAEIREAFGGRAPRVLDPFAGGRAIPLEAMRLGWEAMVADIKPVAWFILRCTLHYPRLLAGEARPLPSFALRDRAFVEEFLKAHGVTKENAVREELARYGHGDGEAVQVAAPFGSASVCPAAGADFAWHLRAWRRRVLAGARRALAARCPTYAGFEQAIAAASVGRAVPRKSGGQSMSGRESVSVKNPAGSSGHNAGGTPAFPGALGSARSATYRRVGEARAPRSARANPEGSSEPTRYRRRSRPRGVRSAFTPILTPAYQKLADDAHGSPREHRRWVTRIGRAAAPETPSSGRVP